MTTRKAAAAPKTEAANTPHVDLATVFNQIDKAALSLDTLAGSVLDAARAAGAKTIEGFDKMVYEAYDKCGWSHRVGRPMEGDVPAPKAIKVYVSTIRGAYRMSLPVLDMHSIDEVRKALAKAREHAREVKRLDTPHPETPAPEMVGVQLEKGDKLIGAMFHDAAVLWENLPEAAKDEFGQKLQKLLEQYTKKAPPALRLVS
ncbi:guanosine nucleotide pyrophosphohydrolase [Pseudomonas phage DDSR119]|nr:guanosine nucleotide pyrophosphohydrolase [Pseudomonas phage DDSR119]